MVDQTPATLLMVVSDLAVVAEQHFESTSCYRTKSQIVKCGGPPDLATSLSVDFALLDPELFVGRGNRVLMSCSKV